MLYATGLDNILISALMFAPGILFYGWSHIQNRQRIFESAADAAAFAVIMGGLVLSLFLGGRLW